MEFAAVAHVGVMIVRPGALLMVAPGFAGQRVPGLAKIALTVFVALALAPAVKIAPGPDAGVVVVVAREVLIGLALGLTARALIAGAELAGHLCSQQIGFSYAATVDPEGGARNTTIATLYGMLATLTWLGIDGHHLLLRALHASYDGLPIGLGAVHASLAQSIRDVLALVFITGLRLAAPVLAVILLVEVALALISRSAPALNFYIIGYPVRLAIGMAILAATLGVVPSVTRSLTERVVEAGLAMAGAFR